MNPLLSRGFDQAIKAGAKTQERWIFIIRSPVDESRPYRQALKNNQMHAIQLITPTTPDERIQKIVNKQVALFIVFREKVTGVQDRIAHGAGDLVNRIKTNANLPLLLALESALQTKPVAAKLADGVVVGSAIVNAFIKRVIIRRASTRSACCGFYGTCS